MKICKHVAGFIDQLVKNGRHFLCRLRKAYTPKPWWFDTYQLLYRLTVLALTSNAGRPLVQSREPNGFPGDKFLALRTSTAAFLQGYLAPANSWESMGKRVMSKRAMGKRMTTSSPPGDCEFQFLQFLYKETYSRLRQGNDSDSETPATGTLQNTC